MLELDTFFLRAPGRARGALCLALAEPVYEYLESIKAAGAGDARIALDMSWSWVEGNSIDPYKLADYVMDYDGEIEGLLRHSDKSPKPISVAYTFILNAIIVVSVIDCRIRDLPYPALFAHSIEEDSMSTVVNGVLDEGYVTMRRVVRLLNYLMDRHAGDPLTTGAPIYRGMITWAD